jgi:hypothetical protein
MWLSRTTRACSVVVVDDNLPFLPFLPVVSSESSQSNKQSTTNNDDDDTVNLSVLLFIPPQESDCQNRIVIDNHYS